MIDLATLGGFDTQWIKNSLYESQHAGFSETAFLYSLLGKQLQNKQLSDRKKAKLFRLMSMSARMHRIKNKIELN